MTTRLSDHLLFETEMLAQTLLTLKCYSGKIYIYHIFTSNL